MVSRRDPRIAQLERLARRLVAEKVASEQAVAALHGISPDPVLLGMAAGRALGNWEVNALHNPLGQEAAALLARAGADRETTTKAAEDTARRLRLYLQR